jgi:sugar phosphate isomerase/epimerase
MTTKPWSLEMAMEKYDEAGVRGISIWDMHLENKTTAQLHQIVNGSDLAVVSYVRGGFFAHKNDQDRKKAIKRNLEQLDLAATIGAPLVVLVSGSDPSQSLKESRDQILKGIEEILPHATDLGIRLGIEPLHPMYADTRSAINTIDQALEICQKIGSPDVGLIVDVYHVWWDPNLETSIARCGDTDRLFAFHVCDWKIPTTDMLNDRGIMGEGCIPISEIRQMSEKAGFTGFLEVEIFSDHYWALDQKEFLKKILKAYLNHV